MDTSLTKEEALRKIEELKKYVGGLEDGSNNLPAVVDGEWDSWGKNGKKGRAIFVGGAKTAKTLLSCIETGMTTDDLFNKHATFMSAWANVLPCGYTLKVSINRKLFSRVDVSVVKGDNIIVVDNR